ncbi:MAG: TSUP family transporter [Chloroflexi bacterium]|nr:TSUP family transporter [Chloroflexota bacterium]
MVTALILKAVLAAVIVGFVTASIKINMDRFFLVILLLFLVGLPFQEAILINLLVVLAAAAILFYRQAQGLRKLPRHYLPAVVGSSMVGGLAGRALGLVLPQPILLILFGIYALGVGLRLVLVKMDLKAAALCPPARLTPLFLFFGLVAGLLSAGGKPYKVPILNRWFCFAPPMAYMLGTVGVASAVVAALVAQLILAPGAITGEIVAWAAFFVVAITAVSLVVERFWSQALQKYVSWTIAPILAIVGVRFLLVAVAG